MSEQLNSGTSNKLLLVYRDDHFANFICQTLAQKNWNIDVARGIEEAIEKVEDSHYDVCVVSNRLRDATDPNDRSEFDLIRELKQYKESPQFIIHTSYPSWQDVRDALSATSEGEPLASDFISQQDGVEVLIQAVERAFISNVVSREELFADSEPPKFIVELINSVNVELIAFLKKEPRGLYQIQPHVFEELVAELLANYGWQVDVTKRTRDGGYDIFAIKQDISGVASSWIIECKRYRPDHKVGIEIVRALYGVKTDLRVGMSMIATTSFFSKDVTAYKTSRYDLELRDFNGIVDWINEYRPNPGGSIYMKENQQVIPNVT